LKYIYIIVGQCYASFAYIPNVCHDHQYTLL
jgi:hypothetical protein